MTLSEQQIEHINSVLVLNGLLFDDLKLEITDHIATEIEVIMVENGLSFEENLKNVLSKWEDFLRPKSSYWLRNTVAIPTIALQKCIRLKQRLLLISICSGLVLTFFSIKILKLYESAQVLSILNSILQMVSILFIFMFFYIKFRIKKTNVITTYSYLFDLNAAIQGLNLLFIGFGIYSFKKVNSYGDLHVLSFLFPITFLFIAGLFLFVGLKHLQFVHKIR